MKKPDRLWALVILFSLLFFTISSFAGDEFGVNTVLLHEQIILPFGEDSCELGSATIKDKNLETILYANNVQIITELFPEFNATTDIEQESPFLPGMVIHNIDLENVFNFMLTKEAEMVSLIEDLNLYSDALFAEQSSYWNGFAALRYDMTNPDEYYDELWYMDAWDGGTVVPVLQGPDVDAPEAWYFHTGSPNLWIAILDFGVLGQYVDLGGDVDVRVHQPVRYWGAIDGNPHGTAVAGIFGGLANNGAGIAGMHWNCQIQNYRVNNGDRAVFYSIRNCLEIENPCRIVNVSGGFRNNDGPAYSLLGNYLFAQAYKMGALIVCARGNEATGVYDDHEIYPAGFGEFILSVGATTINPTDYSQAPLSSNSLFGDDMDLVAPGGDVNHQLTVADGSYPPLVPPLTDVVRGYGTSFSAPHATGLAGLVHDYAEESWGVQLLADDLQAILKQTTVWHANMTDEDHYGSGLLNAYKAMQLVSPCNTIHHRLEAIGTPTVQTLGGIQDVIFVGYDAEVPLAGESVYLKSVTLPISFSDFGIGPLDEVPYVWGNSWNSQGSFTSGIEKKVINGYNFKVPFCDVVPGTVTQSGCVLRTFVFCDLNGDYIPMNPTDPNFNLYFTVVERNSEPMTAPTSLTLTASQNQHPQLNWTDSPSLSVDHYMAIAQYTCGGESYTEYYEPIEQGWEDDTFLIQLHGACTAEYWVRAVDACENQSESSNMVHTRGLGGILKEANLDPMLPDHFALNNIYPNPFNSEVRVDFQLPEASHVIARIYSIEGRNCGELISGNLRAGYHQVAWQANSLASGVYIIQFEAGDFRAIRKIVLMK